MSNLFKIRGRIKKYQILIAVGLMLILLQAIYGSGKHPKRPGLISMVKQGLQIHNIGKLGQKVHASIYEDVPSGGKVVVINIPPSLEFTQAQLEDMEKRDILFHSFNTGDPAQFYLGNVYFIDYRPLQPEGRDKLFQGLEYEAEREKDISVGRHHIKIYNNVRGVKFSNGKEAFYRLKAGEKLTGFVLPNRNWKKRLTISCLNFPQNPDGIFPMVVEVVGYTQMKLMREPKDKKGIANFTGELIFGGGLNKIEVVNRSQNLDILISEIYLEDPGVKPPPTQATFSGLEHLKQLYENQAQSLQFRAEDMEGWKKWQALLQAKLKELLGISQKKCSLNAKILGVENKGDYIMERIAYQSEPGVSVPAYLLLPKRVKFPRPAVIALHGHGPGKDEIVGKVDCLRNSDFGLQLVKRGFVVLAPDLRGFGDRATGEDEESEALALLLFDRTMMGGRVLDTLRAIDYLETRPEVDAEKIDMVGLSIGGAVAMFTAALDERVNRTVVSGYFGTFKSLNITEFLGLAPCAVVPGILLYAELYDIAGLIAPRPLLIEVGNNDKMIPTETAYESFQNLKKIYSLAGAEDELILDLFEGGHQFNGKKSYPWLEKDLLP